MTRPPRVIESLKESALAGRQVTRPEKIPPRAVGAPNVLITNGDSAAPNGDVFTKMPFLTNYILLVVI